MLYIAKIISFVLALGFWFIGACSTSLRQAVTLLIIGAVLFILAFLFEQIDQADWELKTKYCMKKPPTLGKAQTVKTKGDNK